ncbi:NAD-dependent epimerase/dehydratase family protein [Devosia sp.]|uniref:NAD-dependent epimerase/dehydratase family protein n=1 Tax=Devosia sp. TaxID=1871048 RepID=UPI003A9456FF
MTVAVIGGTGFIGTAVCRRLLARGHEVVAVARGTEPVTLPPGAVFAKGDRMDAARLGEIFAEHGVDTVIDIFALGMLNTSAVFEAMGTRGGRYLLLSSVDVYSNYGGLLRREQPDVQLEPAREDDPLRSFRYPYRGNPNRPKGVSAELFEDYDKIVLEEAVRADTRFESTIIRAPMIFGPDDKQHRFKWAIDAAKAGGLAKLDERASRWPNSYGYVDDVADAMVLAATDPRAVGRTYNVGQNFVRTPIEWLLSFAVVLNRSLEVETVPPTEKGLLFERAEATDLSYPLTLDTTRIRAELGYAEPTPEREALLATIAAETA